MNHQIHLAFRQKFPSWSNNQTMPQGNAIYYCINGIGPYIDKKAQDKKNYFFTNGLAVYLCMVTVYKNDLAFSIVVLPSNPKKLDKSIILLTSIVSDIESLINRVEFIIQGDTEMISKF